MNRAETPTFMSITGSREMPWKPFPQCWSVKYKICLHPHFLGVYGRYNRIQTVKPRFLADFMDAEHL